MKIAQIAPLYESVPPKLYGGTERVVSYLTEALVKLGHEVTLYASGDSVTAAQLRALCQNSLRLDTGIIDPVADHVLLAERVFQESGAFDVIHSHIDYMPYSLFRQMTTPHVTTLHGRLDLPSLSRIYREFNDIPVISISDHQRLALQGAKWMSTVYHGLPKDLHQLHEKPGKYLAFLGRVSPEKRVDDAIEIAKKAGIPLKIAAKVDKVDQQYFDRVIVPLLDHPLIEYIGEIGEAEKEFFLGNAYALLFPIDWPEPFGLVMIEAMACGTPIIARNRGSVPEVMEEGVTGFVIEDVASACKAVAKIPQVDRKRCRQVFESRFTSERMALNYVAVYEQLIAAKSKEMRVA